MTLGSISVPPTPSTSRRSPRPTKDRRWSPDLDDQTRKSLEDTHTSTHAKTVTTGQWSFDPAELESAVTQAGPIGGGDRTQTSRLQALREGHVDVDLSGEDTGTHAANGGDLDVDLSGTGSTGTHAAGNGEGLDLDVGTATVPDTAFAATQRLQSEDLALPDLEPVTMSEVGTKLDLARAYMDMGDPEGARNILEEVLSEGSAAQKQEAQRLMESCRVDAHVLPEPARHQRAQAATLPAGQVHRKAGLRQAPQALPPINNELPSGSNTTARRTPAGRRQRALRTVQQVTERALSAGCRRTDQRDRAPGAPTPAFTPPARWHTSTPRRGARMRGLGARRQQCAAGRRRASPGQCPCRSTFTRATAPRRAPTAT